MCACFEHMPLVTVAFLMRRGTDIVLQEVAMYWLKIRKT